MTKTRLFFYSFPIGGIIGGIVSFIAVVYENANYKKKKENPITGPFEAILMGFLMGFLWPVIVIRGTHDAAVYLLAGKINKN